MIRSVDLPDQALASHPATSPGHGSSVPRGFIARFATIAEPARGGPCPSSY
ncbi:hypothetical protein [Lysobacter gummosus]|uniref:hypothetical protein n=1 Tax=Lysobacter gummosus TaxID=262324 RepID=UPI0036390083